MSETVAGSSGEAEKTDSLLWQPLKETTYESAHVICGLILQYSAEKSASQTTHDLSLVVLYFCLR